MRKWCQLPSLNGKTVWEVWLAFVLVICKSLKVQKSTNLLMGAIRSPTSSPATGGTHTRITDLQYKKNTGRVELYNTSGDVTLTATHTSWCMELYLWVWNVSSLLWIYDYPFLLISRAMTNILTCEPISLGNVLYILPGCLLAMRYSANDKQLATCV